jgi:hypothetical protein
MKTTTVDVWQYCTTEEDRGAWETYRIAGCIDDKPFCCEISMEVDGRDCELKTLWGVDVAPDGHFGDDWDSVLEAIHKNTSMTADMGRRLDADDE